MPGQWVLPNLCPDNYRRLAVDFDGDGKKDILNNPADAIGSVANFLSST
jgi:membrane-bound lytic murein transglycosylase B